MTETKAARLLTCEVQLMQFDKQTVINLIEEQMGSQHAEQAAQQLPDQVDHERHADLLQKVRGEP
jgi:hypothetical protein